VIEPLIAAPNLIDQTYQQLLRAIADGTLPAGSRIRQAELAARLGVSRQPVSHALHLLKRQGLVEETGGKGMRVVPLDPLRVLQLYEVRAVVDGLAARLAARRIAAGTADPKILMDLQALVGKGASFSLDAPIAVLVRADTDFHQGLCRLSGNPAIEEMTAPLWPHLMRSMAFILDTPSYRTQVWGEHTSILTLVAAGDAEAAETAARHHAATAATLTAERLPAASQAA
jgi:DNA-binding GntR family transcriptional regulator